MPLYLTWWYVLCKELQNYQENNKFQKVFDNLPQTVISCFRRSLTYPLYCNWELSYTVWNHTKSIFKMGKRHLLKSLLAIKQMFQFSDFKRHLNTIYIDDYCVWIQSVRYVYLFISMRVITKKNTVQKV